MLNIHPLYSSSSGNLYHLESSHGNILIDAGVSYKAIQEGLASIEKDISDISAVIVTHEHSDHIKGLPVLCKKNQIPIYACGKTASYLSQMLDEKKVIADITEVHYGQPFSIDDLEITPFETSHDAVMPCGYTIESEAKKIALSTDLGYMSESVFEYIKDSEVIVLESNYDESMLQYGSYPYPVKQRIKSNLGHLSNIDSANTMIRILKNNNPTFVLAHLSPHNNSVEMAKNTIDSMLLEHDIPVDFPSISFASKTLSSEVYCI